MNRISVSLTVISFESLPLGAHARSPLRPGLLLDDAEDFFLTHNQELFAIDLDFGAGILAEQDFVTGFNVERENLPFVVRFTLADGDHFALLRLFLGAIRNNDAPANRLRLFETADENPIMERSEGGLHRCCWHNFASPSRASRAEPGRELCGFTEVVSDAPSRCRSAEDFGIGSPAGVALAVLPSNC